MTGGNVKYNTMEILETWVQLNGFEEYEINPSGVVRLIESKIIITPYLHSSGYISVKLNGDTKRVHRLVAGSFIPNDYQLPQVNHKDGRKWNNHVSNLEWVSALDNIHHAIKTNLINSVRYRKPVIAILQSGEEIEFKSRTEAAEYFNTREDRIGGCICKNRKYKGIVFKNKNCVDSGAV